MISFLRRSIPNFKDEETELSTKEKRGSSATSVTSSQDEGIHSTGEKEEDDINDEDLPDNKLREGDENGNNEDQEEDDEGRGSLIGGKITDDESEEPGYIGDAEDTPITSAIGHNESDEETLKNEESEVDLDGTEDEREESIEEAPDEDVAVEKEEDKESDEEESAKLEVEEAEESAVEEAEDSDHGGLEKELVESEDEDQKKQGDEESEHEVDEPKVEEEELAVEDQETEKENDEDDVQKEYNEEAIEDLEEPVLESIEEAAEQEENEEQTLEVPVATIESEGEKSIAEEPAIAVLPGTKTRKKKKIIDMSKVTANRKPLYTRAAMPISSKKENTNFKPQLKSKTDFHRQKTFRLKRKPPNVTLNNENKENELPPLKKVFRKTETSEEVSTSGNGPTEFLNPHMDHSLKRPRAPQYRIKTSEINNKTPRANLRESKGTEVYVPDEEKLYVYSYSSIPRVLHSKRMTQRKFSTQFTNDVDSNTSLRLKFRNARLIRGSTFGKDGMPQWDPYFAYARCLSRNDFQFYETEEVRQRREEFRKQLRERARVRRKVHGTTSVFQTNNLHSKGQYNKDSSILEGSSEGTVSYGTTPRYRKQRPSISVATQVSEGERSSQLVTARSPETAAIKALVANTLREAAMEVAAEAEEDRTKMENFAESRLSTLGAGIPNVTSEEPEPMEEDAKDDDEAEEANGEAHLDEASTVEKVGADDEDEDNAEEDEEAESKEEEAEEEAADEADAGPEAEEEAEGETENEAETGDADETEGEAENEADEANEAEDEETEAKKEEEEEGGGDDEAHEDTDEEKEKKEDEDKEDT